MYAYKEREENKSLFNGSRTRFKTVKVICFMEAEKSSVWDHMRKKEDYELMPGMNGRKGMPACLFWTLHAGQRERGA